MTNDSGKEQRSNDDRIENQKVMNISEIDSEGGEEKVERKISDLQIEIPDPVNEKVEKEEDGESADGRPEVEMTEPEPESKVDVLTTPRAVAECESKSMIFTSAP